MIDFVLELFKAAKKENIHTCIDTSGITNTTLKGDVPVTTDETFNSWYKASESSLSLLTSTTILPKLEAAITAEENAAGGMIVTAPTCGSSGVLPAVLYHLGSNHAFSEERILHALATAGLIGNLVKHNASISGANVGCQGEVGTACAMASAAACQLFGGSVSQIEYAAEMGLEHHLGLTCDPIKGLVQIPCIERNAVAAMRSINAISLANFLTHTRKISFDTVVKTMYETGRDIKSHYRETSEGGLAKHYFSCD